MRAIPAYLTPTTAVIAAATATVLLVACTGAGSSPSAAPAAPTGSDIAATSSAPVSSTAPTVSSTATTSSSPITGPASTTPTTGVTPTLPADVPTIGANMRAGEKPPIEPVAALVHTSAGAKAFAVFFIKTIDWGYATTSSTYMRHYYDASCLSCRAFADQLTKDQEQDVRYLGGRFFVYDARAIRHSSAGVQIKITFDVTGLDKISPPHHVRTISPPEHGYHFEVTVAWFGSGWRVARLAATS